MFHPFETNMMAVEISILKRKNIPNISQQKTQRKYYSKDVSEIYIFCSA